MAMSDDRMSAPFAFQGAIDVLYAYHGHNARLDEGLDCRESILSRPVFSLIASAFASRSDAPEIVGRKGFDERELFFSRSLSRFHRGLTSAGHPFRGWTTEVFFFPVRVKGQRKG
ncbi:hypothetical protein TNIN_9051 [Trichonephila inaurata madagascariensis]|uniref:Uncharacterized protein n=1 Tax=Trichonephila inaurata madagascariensis TaxID=2747483 RepID=A0A8X6YL69_9ARAC|nr:hypothetical protein TNIN_9051 [Trichonephila inaurata madagascariensis]